MRCNFYVCHTQRRCAFMTFCCVFDLMSRYVDVANENGCTLHPFCFDFGFFLFTTSEQALAQIPVWSLLFYADDMHQLTKFRTNKEQKWLHFYYCRFLWRINQHCSSTTNAVLNWKRLKTRTREREKETQNQRQRESKSQTIFTKICIKIECKINQKENIAKKKNESVNFFLSWKREKILLDVVKCVHISSLNV